MLNTYNDYKSMENNEISPARFSYRLTGTVSSAGSAIYIGGAYGGPHGAIAGALVTSLFYSGEQLYDGLKYVQKETAKFSVDFENAMKNGWYPGKH